MLRKSQLHFRKSLTIWSFVIIILASSVYVEAAKAARRSGQKGKPNHDAIALSYGGSRHTGTMQQHQSKQVYPQAASAPPLPHNNNNNNNKPIGWNIPSSNTPIQQKTVSNTNTGFPAPAHNSGYAPPPYNTHTQYPQQPASNAVQPPAYTHSGPPPAYSAPIGAPNTGYPQQGVHNLQQGGYSPQQPAGGYNPQQSFGGYNPQQGGYHPQPAYPQGVNNPNPSYQQPMGGQQTPVINNYYQQPTQTGGTGSSIAKNALLLGAGGLAGAAIYGALKPGEETKTIVIHDTVPGQPPNVSPAAAAPTTVQETNIPLAQPNVPLAQPPSNIPLAQPNVPLAQPPSNIPLAQPNVPLAQPPSNIPLAQPSTDVPLAAMPDTAGMSQSTAPNMPGSETTIPTAPIVQLAPMPEPRSNNNTTNAEIPALTNPSSQAHLKGHATYLEAFNISAISMIMILAKLLI